MQLLDDYTIAHIVESMIPVAVRDGVYDETMSDVMHDLCKLTRTSKRMHDVVEPIILKYASMSLLDKNHLDGIVYVDYRGRRHRVDGPAVVKSDGTRIWYQDDKRHRVDGPAIECANGTRIWYRDNKLHRVDGPAVEWVNGIREWYQEGKRHREDGPAIEWSDGSREWYQEGKLHRVDGPAVDWVDGTREWYRDGVFICEEHP
jgi:hypothetical protein